MPVVLHLYLWLVIIRNHSGMSRDGAVVRTLAFCQCDPGSILCSGVICGLSLLLVLVLAQGQGSFSGHSSFSPSIKTNISKFQFDLDVKCLHMSPWLGRCRRLLPHYDVKFDLSFLPFKFQSIFVWNVICVWLSTRAKEAHMAGA